MNYFEKAQLKHELLAKARAAKLQRYKDDRLDHQLLLLSQEGTLGGRIEETLSKKSLHLPNGNVLDYITHHNLNRDTTVLLHTEANLVRDLLRAGQLNPQALSSKAIKAAGKYRTKEVARAVKSRIESNHKAEKDMILSLAQDRIEALQEIERFIGHRIHQPTETLDQLLAALDRYAAWQDGDALTQLRHQYIAAGFSTAYFNTCLAADKKAAQDLRAYFNAQQPADAAWLQSSGYDLLHSFIKNRCTDSLKQSQALNQILTHRGAYLRGDLSGYLEDALFLVGNERLDFHNPITADHQLIYADLNQPMTIDSDDHTDGGRESLEELLLMVSHYCGDNASLDALKGPVQVTAATKWRHLRAFFDGSSPYATSLFSSLSHLMGVIWNWVLAPFNLFETIIRGNAASFFASLAYQPIENADAENKSDYYALIYWVKENTTLSTRIGLLVHRIFSQLFWEGLALGVYDGLKRLLRLPAELLTDFQNQEASPEELLPDLQRELMHIQLEEQRVSALLGQDAAIEAELPVDQQPYYARADIPLSPYNSQGLLKSFSDGFISVVDLFGHHMFAKHPFTGLLSTAGAGASLLAFYATPTAVSLMGPNYVRFLFDQGFLWSRDYASAAISSAISNFELVGAVVEGIEHGPDSWLSRGMGQIVKDPAAAITFTTLSWMLGYAMVYQIDIPGLSEELRGQMGDIPEPTEIVGGGKVLFLGKHLLGGEHEKGHALRRDYIQQSVNLYKAMQKQNGLAVSAEDEAQFRAGLEKLLTPAAMSALQNDLAQQFSKEDRAQLALTLSLAANKERLKYLSPLLRAKLEHQLPTLTGSASDAAAVEKWLDPERYHKQSTIRSFISRVLSYIPALIRCALTPLMALVAGSLRSAYRPWKELGAMFLDDLTSTVHAALNLMHKILDCIFNRFPRTILDVVVNSIFARVASFCGYDGITAGSYRISASWDKTQESLRSNSTGWLMNSLARVNTTAHPEIGLENAVESQVRMGLGKTMKAGFFADAALRQPINNPVMPAKAGIQRLVNE